MVNERIFITGGAGYIGSHVVKSLAEKGCDLLVFDNLSTGNRDAAVYGIPESSSVEETASLRPINPYGVSKMMVDNECLDNLPNSDYRRIDGRNAGRTAAKSVNDDQKTMTAIRGNGHAAG